MNPVGYGIAPMIGMDGDSKSGQLIRTGAAYNYKLAGNGVFVLACGEYIGAVVPVAQCQVRGLAEQSCGVTPFHGRIPQRYWEYALTVFRRDPGKEIMLCVVWKEETHDYQLLYPPQKGTAGGVSYAPQPDTVLEIHSHGSMSAFFSAQDDRDEQGLKLYGVVGNLAAGMTPQVAFRVGVYGYFMPLRWQDVFEGVLRVAVECSGKFEEVLG